ncbi:MAG: hypothetical protein HY518_00300 [Candidatus Aenigmarchaeota archaeon]|nr:hypothetical protein [Candidatus Aenigmarchaeota archaeon]
MAYELVLTTIDEVISGALILLIVIKFFQMVIFGFSGGVGAIGGAAGSLPWVDRGGGGGGGGADNRRILQSERVVASNESGLQRIHSSLQQEVREMVGKELEALSVRNNQILQQLRADIAQWMQTGDPAIAQHISQEFQQGAAVEQATRSVAKRMRGKVIRRAKTANAVTNQSSYLARSALPAEARAAASAPGGAAEARVAVQEAATMQREAEEASRLAEIMRREEAALALIEENAVRGEELKIRLSKKVQEFSTRLPTKEEIMELVQDFNRALNWRASSITTIEELREIEADVIKIVAEGYAAFARSRQQQYTFAAEEAQRGQSVASQPPARSRF